VYVTGTGKSGIIATKIAATLRSTGTPATFLHPSEALHGDIGVVSRNDIVLSIGKSGETSELNELLRVLKKIGTTIIAITSNGESSIAALSDLVLQLKIPREACHLNLAPTASTTAALAVGDAIAVTLMNMCYSHDKQELVAEPMTTTRRFTSADLEAFPDNDGKRYEIIDGELYVSRQPHAYHQLVCARIASKLLQWTEQSGDGAAFVAPGIIFAEDDDVAPDVVWASSRRLSMALKSDGKFHSAPELIVEALSPGAANERRDRDAKLKLYSRRGVEEYWIVDWHQRRVEIYRRENAQLALTATLSESDTLGTPLLAGFTCRVVGLFTGIPAEISATD